MHVCIIYIYTYIYIYIEYLNLDISDITYHEIHH